MPTAPLKIYLWFMIIMMLAGALSNVWAAKVAEPSAEQQSFTSAPEFDPQAAHQQLDQLSIKLSIQNLNRSDLEDAVARLKIIKQKAELCVKQNNQTLKELTAIGNDTSDPEPAQPGESLAYLTHRKQALNERLTSCQLFILRANEAIQAFSQTAQSLAAHELLANQASLWTNLQHIHLIAKDLSTQLAWQRFYQHLGIEPLKNPRQGGLLLGLAILGTGLGYWGRYFLQRYTFKADTQWPLYTLLHSLLYILQRYLPLLALLLGIISSLTIIFLKQSADSLLIQVTLGLLWLLGYKAIIELFFAPPQPAKPIISLPYNILPLMRKRLIRFGSLLYLGYVTLVLFEQQSLSEPIRQLFSSLYITLLSLHLLRTLWLIHKAMPAKKSLWSKLLHLFLSSLVLAIITADWLGHTPLAWFILTQSSFTLLGMLLIWLSHLLIMSSFDVLSGTQAQWQQSLRQTIGLKKTSAIPELIWLRLVLILLVWTSAIWLLLKIWQLPVTDLHHFLDAITIGFTVANITIVPSRIVTGFITFPLLMLLSRWLKQQLANRSDLLILNQGTREALATIVGYLSFVLAMFISLLLAGVNFSGLTLIAGALSVGIGFGLQNIVSNFISGLILLIERPIKVGDRIIVGDLEGHVKKISIRSTQIRSTQEFSDIIVPNSQLIAERVTNLMLHDSEGRLSIPIGVAYGSDTALVRQILLEVTNQNPEILPNRTEIWFKAFGESTLNFELRCIIKNIDRKYEIISDLLLNIDQQFRLHHIEIPFPQRDIHIRSQQATSLPPL